MGLKIGPLRSARKLPAPRLELRWRAATQEEQSGSSSLPFACEYNFVFPLDSVDIRAETEGPRGGVKRIAEAKLNINVTLSTVVNPLRNGYIDTPHRDGAHIQWDAKHFGSPPLFVVASGKAQQLTIEE